MSESEGGGDQSEMPAVLKELGAKAIERHKRRSATPEIEVASEDGTWTFKSPYQEADLDAWHALLFDAFATRSLAAFHAFTGELAHLCSKEWQGEGKGWIPNSWELRAAIQIVRSTKPRNEAEACLAAQMVAVHRMQMKLSARALNNAYPEARSCAIAGKLARTYAMQLETMAKLKGKSSRQRITVRKFSQHEHKHIHIHQGDGENGNQPHGPRDTGTAEINSPRELTPCASLPSPDEAEYAVLMPSGEGEKEVSAARGSKRSGSARG